MQHRHVERELMDDPALAAQEHLRALRGLERINRWSLAARALWPAMAEAARQSHSTLRALDLASGGGDVAIQLWQRAQREGVDLAIEGCDVSERAVEFASQRAASAGADVRFTVRDVLRDPLPSGFDVMMCSLFAHHVQDAFLAGFLRGMREKAQRMAIVLDLERRPAGLALAYVATRALSRSNVVHVDGPRSVRAALSRAEMRDLARTAGMDGATIERCWPMRFLLVWRKPA